MRKFIHPQFISQHELKMSNILHISSAFDISRKQLVGRTWQNKAILHPNAAEKKEDFKYFFNYKQRRHHALILLHNLISSHFNAEEHFSGIYRTIYVSILLLNGEIVLE